MSQIELNYDLRKNYYAFTVAIFKEITIEEAFEIIHEGKRDIKKSTKGVKFDREDSADMAKLKESMTWKEVWSCIWHK